MTDADNREALEYSGSSGTIGNWYAYALGPNDVLNQMNVASSTRGTLIPDVQGSIIGTLDASSGTLTKTGYQVFGENPSLTSGSYQYTARRFDPETAGSTAQPSGLYYYRSRMYSPAWGRFMQVDPIGYAGGSNLYRYVRNDPLNLTDPYGFAPDSPQPQAGGAGGNGGQPPDVAAAAAAEEPENSGGNYIQLASMVQNPYALEQQGLFPECDLCGESGGGYSSAAESIAGASAAAGFSPAEVGVINEASSILSAPEFAQLNVANQAGQSAVVNIGGRMIQYEPGLPASGMTMFGENGFLLGPEAFSSQSELNQTILQELYRLNFSQASGGVSAELAAQETNAAASFAARAAGQLP